jgi:hypothetical protein
MFERSTRGGYDKRIMNIDHATGSQLRYLLESPALQYVPHLPKHVHPGNAVPPPLMGLVQHLEECGCARPTGSASGVGKLEL